MELWIRSQDKERLIKPVDFYIEETLDYINKTGEFDIYCLTIINDDIKIGIYNSKERALEVLDEIQNILTTMLIFNNIDIGNLNREDIKVPENSILLGTSSDNSKIECTGNYVYQMPKE